jgi:hypothetical protein
MKRFVSSHHGDAAMSAPAPRCRYCGGPIRKDVRTVWLHDRPLNEYERRDGGLTYRHLRVDTLPRTKAECQTLTNWTVLSVKRDYRNGNVISRFGEWDGESYADPYFCNGDHARRFAYICAEAGTATNTYNKVVRAAQEVVG